MQAFIERFDRFQREHLVLGYPLAVLTRFKEHNGPRLAANISYFAFFSVFPLMIGFVSIIGIVLEDRPDLQDDLVDSALANVPVLGTQIASATDEPITGSIPIVIIGIGAALWAGSRMIDALTFAYNELWDVPPTDRPMNMLARLKGILVLGVFGLGLAASTFLVGLPAIVELGALAPLVGLVASAATSIVVLALSLKLLVARPLGAARAVAGCGSRRHRNPRDLQHARCAGSSSIISGSSDTYGAFAGIITLLVWFQLIFQVLLLSVEISVVRTMRLVPRTISSRVPRSHRRQIAAPCCSTSAGSSETRGSATPWRLAGSTDEGGRRDD